VLMNELGEPLFSTTMILPDEKDAIADPYDIRARIEHSVDLIIDAGFVSYAPTTIIDLSDKSPEIIRQGKGEVLALM